jgi:3-dehydroquinate dehydratase type I
MTVKVCAVVTAPTIVDVKRMLMKAEQYGADIVELRMDYLTEKCNVGEIRRFTSLPLIATNRLQEEGGFFRGSNKDRVECLLDAAASGFEFIDIELMSKNSGVIVKRIRNLGAKSIVSHHIFTLTPKLTEIRKIMKREVALKADICKIITTAKTLQDNLTCLRFVVEVAKSYDIICFCMGDQGLISRLLSPIFGGYLTYASVGRGKESARGQLTVEKTKQFYELIIQN